MSNRRATFGIILLAALIPAACLLWYVRLNPPPFSVVDPGHRLTVDDFDFLSPEIRERLAEEDFYFSIGTRVIEPPEVGLLFSTVKPPANPEQFAYLLLFKYGDQLDSYSSFAKERGPVPVATFDGTNVETTEAFTVNGKPVEITYRLELDDSHSSVSSESLNLGKDRVDLENGRVILMDLLAEALTYRQVNADLPNLPHKLETKEQAQRAADAIRTSLAEQNEEIEAFLQQ